MATARWNGAVLAQSEGIEVVEGNVYFPPDSVDMQYFEPSQKQTICNWKGVASYYDIVVDGQRNEDAAWYYPETKDAATHVQGYVAFWRGVEVSR